MAEFVWKRGHTLAAVVVGVLVLGGGATVIALNSGGQPAASPSVSATAEPVPSSTATTTPAEMATNPLTGGKVSDHGVFAVKVENIAAARPQVGLGSADIVFAEEVEGAQTRLVAVYHSRLPKRVGPVRSARSTDVQLLPLFGKPGLIYSGANTNVQAKIDHAPIVPIERSTRDPRRAAPHNVFVDLASIAATEKAGQARDIGWRFAADDPRWDAAAKASDPSGLVGNDTFRFTYSGGSGGSYVVRWRGLPYTDGDRGTKATTDNVVVMSVHNHPDGNRDVLGAPSVMSDTVGTGKVTIYRDGRKLSGTWTRTSREGKLRFTDVDGKDIPLRPGNTWVLLAG